MAIDYLKELRTTKPACFYIMQEAVRTMSILPNIELCHVKRERERNDVANKLALLAKSLNHVA